MQSNPTMTDLERDLMGMRQYPPVLHQLNHTWRFVRRWPVIPMFILAVLVFCGIFAPSLATHGEAAGGIRDRHYPPIWMDDERYDRLQEQGETPFNCLWEASVATLKTQDEPMSASTIYSAPTTRAGTSIRA